MKAVSDQPGQVWERWHLDGLSFVFCLCLSACICWILLLKTSPNEKQGGRTDFQNQVGRKKRDDTVWGAGREGYWGRQ